MSRERIRMSSGGRAFFGASSRFAFCLLFLASALCLPASVLRAQTELGSEDDLTVLGADGTVPDPDAEIKGFTVFGSTNLLTHISTAPGNVVINGALEVSSDVYVVGKSTFASNIYIVGFASATKYYGDGSSLTGISGDNLGDHNATTRLNMGSYAVWSSSDITAARYQIGGSTVLAILPGADSLGVGIGAGRVNTGANNSFVGYQAGYSNTTGVGNSFMGAYAGQNNSTGWYNVSMGDRTGQNNPSGAYNSLFGYAAGRAIQVGSANSIFGAEAGFADALGYFSSTTLMGYQAGFNLSTGSDNIFLGFKSGYTVTSGTGNIIIGYNKGTSAPGASSELNIGGVLYGDLSAKTIGISTRIPQAALDIVSTGTLINQYAQIWRASNGTIVSSMTATGVLYPQSIPAGDNLGNHTGTAVLQMGAYGVNTSSNITAARYQIDGSTVLAILPGVDSFGIGVNAGIVNTASFNLFVGAGGPGKVNTTGNFNSFLGSGAGYKTTIGANNSFLGSQAGWWNTAGANNSFFGAFAGYFNTGDDNSFMGSNVGYQITTGGNNAFLGSNAGRFNETGSANVLLGKEAGYGVTLNSFSSATIVGYRAGYGLTTGNDNIFMGWQAGYNVTTGTGNIIVGYNQPAPAANTNNLLNIGGLVYGSLSAKTVGINRAIPQAALDIVSTGTLINQYAQIWRASNGTIVSSMTSTGVLYPQSIPAGDNLGNHTGTAVLQMGAYGVNTSSDITAARYQINGSTVLAILPGGGSMAVGTDAGKVSVGQQNLFLGVESGFSNTSGTRNTFVGFQSGRANIDGNYNSYLGYLAGYNATGTGNVMLGYRAGVSATGNNNVFLGYEAGFAEVGSNKLYIANSNTNSPLIYGDFSAKTVGISTGNPQAALDIVSTGTLINQYAQIWRASDGTIVSSMTATGVLYPQSAGDNLGNHTGTQVLQMGAYGVNTSSNITAARYQINGSTMVAILPGTNSIAYGVYAGTSNITGGNYNVFIGNYAGTSNTTGDDNTANGYQALYSNTTGIYNTANGAYALYANTTGGSNTANGSAALYANTTGNNNTANGVFALYRNTTANNNTANGSNTLIYNTTGGNNTANGVFALYRNTTASNNTANGYQALYNNETGSANSVFGVNAGGFGAGIANSFSSSTIMGYQAGYNLTTGSDNTFLGWQSGYNSTTGAGNIVIGYNKDTSAPGANNELNIGGVLYGDLSAKTIGISTRAPQAALDIVSTGTLINQYAQIWRASNGTIVSSMTATGVLYPQSVPAGDNLGDHTGTQVLQMGAYGVNTSSAVTAAGYQINGRGVLRVLTGLGSLGVGLDAGAVNTNTDNTFVGYRAGTANTTGESNSYFGTDAGLSNVGGISGTFVGAYAGRSTTGSRNSFIGAMAGYANGGGTDNSFVGAQAGSSNTGGLNNTFLGSGAGMNTQTGNANTLVGASAGYGVSANSFSNAVIVGYRAGYALTTGGDNVLIGYQAGDSLTTGAQNILIGYNSDASAAAASSELNIGGLVYGDLLNKTVGINRQSQQAALDVVSTGTLINQYAQIWRNSADAIVASMTATGVMMAAKFVGDGSGITGISASGISEPGDVIINADSDANDTGGIKLRSGGADIVYVSTDNRVGIGTTSPKFVLDINPSAANIRKLGMGGVQVVYLPDQASSQFEGTLVLGTGGGNLSHTIGTQGQQNTFIGISAGEGSTTADQSVMVGYTAGQLSTGSNQTLVGAKAGAALTSGSGNTFIGSLVGVNNQTGGNNVAVGVGAGWGASGNSYSNNSIFGSYTGSVLTTGSNNVFMGYRAGDAVTSGGNNILVGYDIDAQSATGDSQLSIGNLIFATGGFGTGVAVGAGNVGIGVAAPGAKLEVAGQVKITGGSPGAGKVLTSDAVGLATWGTASGDNLGNHTGTAVLQMGAYGVNTSSDITAARYQINGSTVLAVLPGAGSLAVGNGSGRVNTANENSFMGYQAGYSNTIGPKNLFIGTQAGYSNNTGSNNSFLGPLAGYFNTTGWGNLFAGDRAGYSNITGNFNSFLGVLTGYNNTTGMDNSFFGAYAGNANQAGSANTIFGNEAGGYNGGSGSGSFSSSTIMGYQAGNKLTTGSNNILLGWRAGNTVTTGAGNIIIGYEKDTSVPTASNELNIGGVIYGNLSAKTIGISTRAPQAALDIVSTGTLINQYAQIWRASNGTIVSSMTATGVLYPQSIPAGDNLGNHTGTAVLQMGAYGVNTSSDITAARYQINGSTMVAILPGTDSIAYGVYAGASNITGGDFNVFIGNYAGTSNTTGGSNTAIGYRAFRLNTTGVSNTATGKSALYSNSSGSNNTANGYQALYSNTTGAQNTANSMGALFSNTSGNGNTANGYDAIYSNTSGSNNTATGNSALYANTTGIENTANGVYALAFNTSGINNTANGFYALRSNTTGDNNTANGHNAIRFNETGSANSVFGVDAGGSGGASGSFSSSTIMGYQAGNKLTTGGDNIFLGWKAGYSATTGIRNIVIGYNTGISAPGANNELNIGGLVYGDLLNKTVGINRQSQQAALDVVSTGTLINQYAQIWRNSADAIVASMTATGVLYPQSIPAGDNLGNHTGTAVLQMGAYGVNTSSDITAARYQINGSTVLAVTGIGSLAVGPNAGGLNTGDYSVFVGSSAGYSNTTGVENSFIGSAAGRANTTGDLNVFLGFQTGYSNTAGYFNSFLGSLAGYTNTTGVRNSFVGYTAGYYNTTGSQNSILGQFAGYYNQTGSANAIFGSAAGGFNAGTGSGSFSSSTIMGYLAGNKITTGSDNILLGFQAGYGVTTGTGNVIIGYDKDTSAPGASNELNIGGVLYGDLSARTIGISTRAPQAALDIVSTGTLINQYAQIWRASNGTIVSSMTATGVLYPQSIPAGDNLGNHTGTAVLQMGVYGVNTSSDITAARYQINGSTVLAILPGTGSLGVGPGAGIANTANYNSFVGYAAGQDNITGDTNAFMGTYSGQYNTAGWSNSFFGAWSGRNNSTGYNNSFIGHQAGMVNTAGSYNSFVGAWAGQYNTTGGGNSFFGASAGYYTRTGSANAIFGREAGYGSDTYSFSSSTLMGYRAGYGLTTGNDNIFLGWQAGYNVTTGTGNIIIGYNKNAPLATTNNHLNIGGVIYGDLSSGNVGVGTANPSAGFQVEKYAAGAYTAYISTSATAGQYSIAVASTGITSINNLVIENRTTDPASPITGQIWLYTGP